MPANSESPTEPFAAPEAQPDSTRPADPAVGPAPGPAAGARTPAEALAARVAAWRRGQVAVDYAVRGVSVPEIAARLGVPESEARAKLRDALARALPETPEVFAALQISRLNETLLVAFSAMAEGGLKAVDRVLRILRALDRQHAAAQTLTLAAACAGEAEPAPTPAPDAAFAGERNPIALQTSENAQNRSHAFPPATSETAATPPALPLCSAQRGGGEEPSAKAVEARPSSDRLQGLWRGRLPHEAQRNKEGGPSGGPSTEPRREAHGGRKDRHDPAQGLETPRFTPGCADPAPPLRAETRRLVALAIEGAPPTAAEA